MKGKDKAEIEALSINTIRMLAVDAIEKAKSGHPGMPMGAAAMAYTLFTKFLRFDPEDPAWIGRDRFILSAGHGSMLLYALLHLCGYDISMDDLKAFRQWGSKTPGHPEYGHTPGVETTTGPLGQGFATGVGMALALRHLAARYNTKDHAVVGERVFGIVGDGDLMEGVSEESAELAGHLGLGNIVYLYDDNDISIEGNTDITFTVNVAERFGAAGWQVLTVRDGNDTELIEAAVRRGIAEEKRPTLIMIKTHIGFGCPAKVGSASCHGSPLGSEHVRETKENLGWPTEPLFYVPAEVSRHFTEIASEKRAYVHAERAAMEEYKARNPERAKEMALIAEKGLPEGWGEVLDAAFDPEKKTATRAASGEVLNNLADVIPWLVGGSADLAPSNNTYLKNYTDFQRENLGGRNIRFGVREHAMAAMLNGMALAGLVPYGGTFLVFADYMRPAIRLAALMGLRVVYVFTHDSIGLGEDGPTHQPVEHLAALRVMPNVAVIRPADAQETAAAWKIALERISGPTALILSRQGLPLLDRGIYPKAGEIERGGYTLTKPGGEPDLILIATGAEVHLALSVAQALAEKNVNARVVNMACFELFDEQPEEYRREVLPRGVKKIAVEAASPFGWERYVGIDGDIVGVETFGASAPADVLFEQYGFSVEKITERALKLIS
ncbi:MAG: transketolase [Deltaproteobacteria bacterium]|nr:transketolase [Candidatus Zymogenaceae bacterium]